jgi:hypothetical protein
MHGEMEMKRFWKTALGALVAMMGAFFLSMMSAAGEETFTAIKNYYFPPALTELRK